MESFSLKPPLRRKWCISVVEQVWHLCVLYLFHLFHTLKPQIEKILLVWWKDERELFYIEEFRAIEREFPNFKFYVVLDNPLPEDNWQVKADIDSPGDGFKGFIVPVLVKEYLSKHPEPEEIEYYFCGPPG